MLNKGNSIIFAAFSIITIAACLVILQAQTTKEICPVPLLDKKQADTVSKIRDSFPVVEYINPSSLTAEEKIKSKKYDEFQNLNPDIGEDNQETSTIDWATGLSALPLEKSQLVILGKVVNAQAHLSPNKKSVFSKFKIEIEKVFKDTNKQKFENDKFIKAEREGGIVKFPSGKETWLLISGQQMPSVGSRYIFFLTNEFPSYGYQKEDLFLLTGYELREGLVFPLDNPNGGTHPIAAFYKGKEESVLLNDLQNSLKLR